MRFTIILALCTIGVVSASSLNKRSFVDDLQNNTQNAFKAFEQFGQTFNDKVQEALKNLFNAFGHKNSSDKAVVVSKRATNPLVLINDLSDPGKFAQDLLKVLADMAMGQGRRKRDIRENIQKFTEEAKVNAEKALKQLFDFLESLKPKTPEEAVVVSKRATNPLVLINDLSDPGKFAQDLLKVLADMALQGRRKRDIQENIQKFTEEAKHNAEKALKQLFALFESLNPQAEKPSDAVTVEKRDIAEDLKKFTESAKQNAEQGIAKLMEFLESFKAQFAHKESEAEKVVSKRDIQETIEKFNKLAQNKAQEAFQNIQKALEQLFKGNPFFQSISGESNDEDSTEKTVSKRDVFDNFEKFSRNTFDSFKSALERFFNKFGGEEDLTFEDAEDEQSTESY